MKFYRMLSDDIRYNLATEEYLMNNVDVSEPVFCYTYKNHVL